MQLADYRIEVVPDSEFRLDGGAMFGVVPRVLWERVCPPDEKNRVRLNMNCLFIETPTEKILVETGIGEKWTEKETQMYGIYRTKSFAQSLFEVTEYRPKDITIVVNTHLHFDHAGGNTLMRKNFLTSDMRQRIEMLQMTSAELEERIKRESDSAIVSDLEEIRLADKAESCVPQFPNARYFVSKSEFEHAESPHERDRASYLPENWRPVKNAGQLELKPDKYEVAEGITVERVRGHSETMQTVRIHRGGKTLFGFFDMVPTRHHLPPPWIMSYDLFPTETLEFKKRVLPQAAAEKWLCHFYHDREMPFGSLESVNGKLVAEAYVEE